MRRAADYRCVFLGRPADHFHHTSGTDVDGVYLDPDLYLPVVRRLHVSGHQVWNLAGCGDGTDAAPNVLRLRRSGLDLVRLGEFHTGGDVELPALFVVELGRMLQRVAADLEADR